MLRHAAEAVSRQAELEGRIRFIEGYIPGAPIPDPNYPVILSNNFLHHLHRPQVLWETIRGFSRPETLVFVTDLSRPSGRSVAQGLVQKYARTEPEILRRDFLNSLLAAFTPREVETQLKEARLETLRVQIISDRHLMVWGRMED
jgi:SAM-dependent methyltransferase